LQVLRVPLPRLSLADYVTVANGVCGLAVLAMVLGRLGGFGHASGAGLTHGQLVVCAAVILFGVCLDVLDGAVARRFGSSGMGVALDTMSDLLTFAVAPAVVLVAARSADPEPWRAAILVASGMFVACSMLRLARFAVFPPPPDGGFYGLPAPSAGGVLIALAFVDPHPALTLAIVLAVSALMVSTIRYPHPAPKTIALLCIYGVALALALGGLIPSWPVALAWLIVVPVIPAAAALLLSRRDVGLERKHA
jgi:CDP-diacylglycerol---serine O-phosphatidyltransferase